MQHDRLLQPVSPARVLEEIAKAVPVPCRDNMIIIGSLAVGYHYRDQLQDMAVRTKDADCLLSPRVAAVDAGVAFQNVTPRQRGNCPCVNLSRSSPGSFSAPAPRQTSPNVIRGS